MKQTRKKGEMGGIKWENNKEMCREKRKDWERYDEEKNKETSNN